VLASCANVRALETAVADTDPSRVPGFFRILMLVGSTLPTMCDPRKSPLRSLLAGSARAALQRA